MDPVFQFYAGPNTKQGGGRVGSSSRSIPVYEGYGFLSSLANRLLFPVMRNAGKDLLHRGLSYLAENVSESRKAKRRGDGFEYGVENETAPPPPKRRRSRRRKPPAISKVGRGRGKRASASKQKGGGVRSRTSKRKRRVAKHHKKRGKASASKNLFSLFNKK